MNEKNHRELVRTPKYNIPIGQATRGPDGTISLRIQKPGKDLYDEIPLELLVMRINSIVEKQCP